MSTRSQHLLETTMIGLLTVGFLVLGFYFPSLFVVYLLVFIVNLLITIAEKK